MKDMLIKLYILIGYFNPSPETIIKVRLATALEKHMRKLKVFEQFPLLKGTRLGREGAQIKED